MGEHDALYRKVTFREFIVERKGPTNASTNVPKENLGEAGVDIGATVEAAATVGDETQGKAG
jgi:hypothetical protein